MCKICICDLYSLYLFYFSPSPTQKPRSSMVTFVDDEPSPERKSKISPKSQSSNSPSPGKRNNSRASVDSYKTSPPKRPQKHWLDDDDSILMNKTQKARVTSLRRSSDQGLDRGAKRQASSDTEEENSEMETRYRDKRLRQVSNGSQIEIDSDSDLDLDSSDSGEDSDDLMDLDYTSRGMKRDRADVGSAFDSDEDVTLMGKRPRRKGRKSSPIVLDPESPRRKRDRDPEGTPESEEDVYRRKYKLLRRKFKRLQEESETSTDGSDVIKVEPFCKGRKIGQEWDSNGTHWKVGPDGRRQRQVILKKNRAMYTMVRPYPFSVILSSSFHLY